MCIEHDACEFTIVSSSVRTATRVLRSAKCVTNSSRNNEQHPPDQLQTNSAPGRTRLLMPAYQRGGMVFVLATTVELVTSETTETTTLEKKNPNAFGLSGLAARTGWDGARDSAGYDHPSPAPPLASGGGLRVSRYRCPDGQETRRFRK